jgi:hypothetical protein
MSWTKEKQRTYSHAYYVSHRDEIKIAARKYYVAHYVPSTRIKKTPAERIAAARKWSIENPEKQRAIGRRWYAAHKQTKDADVKRRRELAQAFRREAKSFPCMDCGVTYPPHVMDFDHRDSATKKFTLHRSLISVAHLKEEMAKCDLVCSNCHRIRTHNRKIKIVGENFSHHEGAEKTALNERQVS